MSNIPAIPLVDVISLSKQYCSTPILGDLKYSYNENFIGRPIDGYQQQIRDICLLAPEAAKMLCKVQNYLIENHNEGLLIFDAYRPLRATKDFLKWFEAHPTQEEIERKAIHYPTLQKQELSHHGYIADSISNHCYGQAVDLTLINLITNKDIDMGACFDFFDEISHATQDENAIGKTPHANRNRLMHTMHQFNFQVHPKEYWHFDYNLRENNEPLDVIIHEQLRGLGLSSIEFI